MTAAEFAQHSRVLTAMTAEFARAVPAERWHFTPAPATAPRPPTDDGRPSIRLGPYSKQLRHVVCVRGVYNDALANGRVDWARSHQHYTGPLEREPLLDALAQQQDRLVELLATIDPDLAIDWDGFPYSLDLFAGEFVQHESIHHGQWSVYAAVGGFDTPASWHETWGL